MQEFLICIMTQRKKRNPIHFNVHMVKEIAHKKVRPNFPNKSLPPLINVNIRFVSRKCDQNRKHTSLISARG